MTPQAASHNPTPQILLPAPPRNILIIKPSALGDIVHTLPILNLLRQRWPEARISWLIGRTFAGLIEHHPQLDEVIIFDRSRLAAAWRSPSAAGELARLIRRLRSTNFDLVIDLQGLLRSGLLTVLTQAPTRVGFANAREGAPHCYTHRIPIESPDQHAIDRYLTITEALGCGRGPVEFHFHTTKPDRDHAAALTGSVGRFAVLLPGTNWVTKRWSIEQFAALVRPLRERHGLATVIAGGPDVLSIAGELIAHLVRAGSIDDLPLVNAAGKTTLPQLVALLERAELVIANDSGPMHIAAALGKPLVTLFGPTNPTRTGPYNRPDTVLRLDIPCSPCYSRRCSHISCMNWLTPEMVLTQSAQSLSAPFPRMHQPQAP